MGGKYNPSKKTGDLLDWCLGEIDSVPYNVTMRWIFYRAVQSMGLTKKDYSMFKQITGRARKSFYHGWKPNTLTDDTRDIHYSGGGHSNPADWIMSLADQECDLEKRSCQSKLVMICFEAMAMVSQFQHYTKGYYVNLIPFKGDASIEYKWRIAKTIENYDSVYGVPIKVLYFGDLDKKGLMIPDSAFKDIRSWCKVPFEFERIGLNEEHVSMYDIPEKIEGEGYQWEALDDEGAKELITTALDREIDLGAIREVEERERQATERWKKIIEDAVENFNDEDDGDDEDD